MKLRQEPMPSDLPILSAEQYGPVGSHRPGKTGKAKKTHPSHAEDGPRKRTKTSSADVAAEANDDGDEKSKRARGRPRLDTTDQTAAERRRTQIRLAQRAYRSRKENAIQTLEKMVSDLQDTNEEMSNAFMKLHDYAVNSGILDLAPDFARELRSTTDKFRALARGSSEGGGSEGQAGSPSRESRKPTTSPQEEDDRTGPSEITGVQPQSNAGDMVWGYDLTAEPDIAPCVSPDVLDVSSTQPATIHAPLGYEVITMPTLENASFPFDFAADPPFPDFFNSSSNDNNDNNNNNDTDDHGAAVTTTSQQPSTTTPTYTPPGLSPYAFPSLNLPSFAFSEVTFGRRLQRSAIQVAYQLITMPNPPRDFFSQVFGFCMLFEPVESIRDRLRRGLARTRDESLDYWGAPFWALGGSGQHGLEKQQGGRQQQQQGDDHNTNEGGSGGGGPADGLVQPPAAAAAAAGNQGTVDVAKHAFDSNFSLGPFDARTTDARDRCLDPRMRISLPGYEGEFYDPEEVELYLRAKGVVIRPGQDYVTAEVDASWLEEGGASVGAAGAGAGGAGGAAGAGAVPPPPAGGGLGGDQAGWVAFAGRRRIVTLDVGAFIMEIVSRATCLGRSPGFRPKDINRAFWLATRGDNILDF